MSQLAGFADLPTELILEIHLLSCSAALPCLNRHYAAVFRSASVPYRIKYLKRKVKSTETSKVLERATRFPLCTLDIFRRLVSTYSPTPKPSFPIARRFFKHLSADSPSADLPYIGALLDFGADVNAHQGFAVYSAVNASNYELLELLYTNTIDPNLSQGVALKTAIKRKDKDMVEYILEASRDKEKLNLPIKKSVKTDALRIAAQGGEWDIFDLLIADGLLFSCQLHNKADDSTRR